jgi:hypothetical protein
MYYIKYYILLVEGTANVKLTRGRKPEKCYPYKVMCDGLHVAASLLTYDAICTAAWATDFVVNTQATMMPGCPVMPKLPNDELVINSRNRATKLQYISIKYTATEI